MKTRSNTGLLQALPEQAQWASLAVSLAPGLVAIGLVKLLATRPHWSFLSELDTWPPELWVITLCGSAATIAGIADWVYHRTAGVVISSSERKAEFLALAFGGLPVFGLMATASFFQLQGVLLVPILGFLMLTITGICYDEFVFHRRRCSRLETALHRVLVLGHGVAFLAWMNLLYGQS